MNSQTIANGIQTLTGIAVLIGLALVVLELRQSRGLARAQLAADGWAEGMALRSLAAKRKFRSYQVQSLSYT